MHTLKTITILELSRIVIANGSIHFIHTDFNVAKNETNSQELIENL